MFVIDRTDPTPVDSQLVRSIRSAVGAGLLEAGDALPTVRQLAVELRINANAVAKAYAALEQEGIVEKKPGVGTVVRAGRSAVAREELWGELAALEDSFLREAASLGFSLDDVIIHLDSRRR